MENKTIILDERNENIAMWEIIVLALILIFTIIGNCLVLISLYLRQYHNNGRKLTRMYFFMMHLSIADLITGLFNVLPQLAWDITFRFQGGIIMCKTIKFLQPLGNYLSCYILTVTAIDRYHAICYPLSYTRTASMRSRIMVYSVWCLALLLCIPQLFVFSYQEISPNVMECWASFVIPYGERIYVTWFSVTVFLLPFIVLVYTYIGICLIIWRNSEINKFDNASDDGINRMNSRYKNRQPLISRARINTVKQMITIVSLYAVTSGPFIGCQLWSTWDPNASKSNFFIGPTFAILALLSSLTSCVNPWIYLGFNRELRIILNIYSKKFILRRKNVTNFLIYMYRSQTSRNRSTDFTTIPVPV